MALVRNSLSMKMKGRAGSFSFYSSKGRQVVRVAQNSTNYGESARRSEAQQVRRVKWANLVNFYKLMGQTLHGAFETKRANETDYNAFMRKNLPIGTVALTKDMAAMGCCCAQEFFVSEGSLPSPGLRIYTVGSSQVYSTRIKSQPDKSWDGETIKDLSADLIAKNSWLKEGMQLSLLVFMPNDSTDNPKVQFTRYEMTLDTKDARDIDAVWPNMNVQVDSAGYIYLADLTLDAYVALILSDSTSGQLHVSTERIVQGDDTNEGANSTDAKVAEAMQSYGVDPTKFLESGDM